VRAVFLLDLGSAARNVVALASRAPQLETERFRRLLVQRLLPELKLDKPPFDELRHLHKVEREKAYLLSHWEQELKDRRFLVVVWHDVPRIVHDVFPELYSDVQQSRVNVVDSDGKIVFGPPLSRGGLTLGRQFETTLYKWTLNVTMNSAAELAAAVARRRLLEMVLVGLSSVVVIAGLFVILIAAYRERRLSNLKSEFVANVSHELKTPLALVRMFGELLQSGRADSEEKRKQYLSIIVNESDRLNALIENVLDFAKVERGQAAYEFSPGRLAEPVARAVEACRVRAEREAVALTLTVEEVPELSLDERAIEIAVINLVDNALKYAPEGKRIAVSVRSRAAGAEVSVADCGPGIAAEDRKRIFERFVRGKTSSGKQVRGSGIGLSLVKHIAEAHGGSIVIEDAKPHGAIFTLRLPRRA
jgi:two-component system phosphate regulon sensor histidine kinase PhoR